MELPVTPAQLATRPPFDAFLTTDRDGHGDVGDLEILVQQPHVLDWPQPYDRQFRFGGLQDSVLMGYDR